MRSVLLRTTAVAGAGTTVLAGALLAAGPAQAAGVLTVSKSTGLAVGDTVTVSAKGLSKNQSFAPLGLCKPDPSGPTDCDTSADAAYIGKTDADGVWHSSSTDATSVKVTIKAQAGGASCTSAAGACVIAVFITATKEMVQVPLTVSASGGSSSGGSSGGSSSGGSSSGGGSSSSAATGPAGSSTAGSGGTADGSGGSSTDDALASTGFVDGVPVGLLAAGTLVLCGSSALLLMPRRRGRHE
ncbi:neocarzinostatin apoprotein domain-containing protein [Streptomyces sp. NPDC059894]|uniref:neocarzinostatin apoprotein domain-containing protein n=1 Tax=unclassified Streptomyces TaxID=2593676 RepID=UPI003660F398